MKSNLIRSFLSIGMLIFSVNLAVAQSNILDTRFDDLYFLEYHNTYAHLVDRSGNDISLNYFLEKNYRDVELDAWKDSTLPQVEVSHDRPWVETRDSNCCPDITHDDRLERCMQTILDWLDGEQGGDDNLIGGVAAKELPFIVNIEIKCGFKQVNDKMLQIWSVNQDKFFTPGDLEAYYEDNFDPNEVPRIVVDGKTFVSLREAVSKFGWPTVGELEGKIIVIYTGGGAWHGVCGRSFPKGACENNKRIGGYIAKSLLSQEHGRGIGFPCPAVSESDDVYPNEWCIEGFGEKDFIVFNSMGYDDDDFDAIIAMSKEKNFLIRRYRKDPVEDSIIVLQFKDFVRKGGNIFAYENENLDIPWDSGPIPTVGLRDERESPGDTGGGGGCFTSSF
jgi:hypothetical protein